MEQEDDEELEERDKTHDNARAGNRGAEVSRRCFRVFT
jgi:hypothetical protein